MPVFALANAGVAFGGNGVQLPADPIDLGITLGLFLGKPVGIFALSWVANRWRLADLPHRVTWTHVLGAGVLGGIGFTMSLFLAALAFSDQQMLATAKLGILLGSLFAAIAGSVMMVRQQA